MKKNRRYMKKLIQQKIIGVVLLLVSAGIVWLASTGVTPEEKDATAVLLIAPLGFYLIFTKDIVLY